MPQSSAPHSTATATAPGATAELVTAELATTRASIAAEFRYFATRRAGTYAPLYAQLAAAIADNPILLDLAARARAGQSRPDLLLALIHDLLMCDPEHPAARFYPSLTTTPADGNPAPAVLQLAHDHHDELAVQIARRLVQTNEVGRCAFLTPAVQAAARRVDAPLALLEIGASAGLNLLLDRYGYRYHRSADEAGAAVAERPGDPVLDCAIEGPGTPPLDQPLHIAWRAGIDLHPLDVTDPADRRWLRALVWPDHRARAARLDAALRLACSSTDRPAVHAGDAAGQLPWLAAAAPPAAYLVIYHSAVAAHMPAAVRQAFTDTVLACSTQRPVSWVQAEPRADRDPCRLRLTECLDGRVVNELGLGSYQPHGQWLRWKDTTDPAVGPAFDGAGTAGQPG